MAIHRRRYHNNNKRFRYIIPLISVTILFIYAFISLLAPSPHHLHHPPLRRTTLSDDDEVIHESNRVPSIFKVPISGGMMSERNLWSTRMSKFYYGCSNASVKFPKVETVTYPNRYLMIATSGGLNQQRTGITDAVVAARILNATLVIPKLDQKSFWKDSSTFSEIFDVEWFISRLSKDVKVIKELPRKGGKVWVPYNMRVPRKCNERCYQIRVLPVLLKKHAVQLSKFDYRLSNKLETDLQKLRCRVNYHALKFTDPINKMGQKLVNRMRKMGKHYVALHLSLADATAAHYSNGLVAPEIEKEYYRVRGKLYSLCRAKLMRLAYLVGYGSAMERSPVNSASLSMLPWPKPAIWPSVPPDASSEVLAKEKMNLQVTPRVKHFGIQRKPLPLEPSFLLREANRRRASFSVGNVSELFDGRLPLMDGYAQVSGSSAAMSRTNSTPGNFESLIGRPMKLAEIFVAAEHALQKTISDPSLWTSFSSLEEYEQKYLELSKAAAENYHNSWWKRHGVVLDGEIAAVFFKHGNYDLAAKSYEKICALYSGEGWEDLLADVLPNLAECQKILNDQAGYLSSCVRLLSLDKGLFSSKERQAFQSEVVRLAHGEMEHPVPLDVSSLITFSGNSGPPLELCDGDPGILSVTLRSGFPDDITLESLSLTLTSTTNADEGVKAIRSSGATILHPGRNTITLSLPPQKTGSYVLGVLTGQIGQLRFRSHGFSRGGPAESDDLMSYEKPTRPILKVFKPRALVDLAAAVSSALLMNEPQWVGIIVKPINYSLKGAVLHIDTGPGLKIEESNAIEMETYIGTLKTTDGLDNKDSGNNNSTVKEFAQLTLEDGSIELPDWASNIMSVLWVPVRAISDGLARGTSAGTVSPERPSVVDGLRTVALKLEFGVSHNQTFERTIAVHFTNPFHVSTRVADKCSDGTLLLQVILHSQVKACLTIHDAWLDLQDGFAHGGKGDGRPTPAFFPLVVPAASRAGILFSIFLKTTTTEDEAKVMHPEDTIINIRYKISGDRNLGSHTPMSVGSSGPEDDATQLLTFRSALVLQRPVLEPCLAVGFLPLPSDGLRVGQLFTMKWRIERLKEENNDEVLYEVNANSENWMIAGRKRGHVSLSTKQGSRIEISVLCVPLAAGYVRPPQLELPNIGEANISCNPAGPHLVCVLPPPLSSSFCIAA